MVEKTPFLKAAQEIAGHPFLQELSQGRLPLPKLERYLSARLQTGPGFVDFLSRLAAQAREQGLLDAAAAAQKNYDEEMGIVNGAVILPKAHHEWRRWFREGMVRVMAERGIVQRADPPADFPEVNGYPQAFAELNARADVPESMGALAVFEQGLGDEYARVLEGLELLFPGRLTRKEMVYIRGHVNHEGRHFDEAYGPLKVLCTTRAHVDAALRGAEIAKSVKLRFLDGAYRGDAA